MIEGDIPNNGGAEFNNTPPGTPGANASTTPSLPSFERWPQSVQEAWFAVREGMPPATALNYLQTSNDIALFTAILVTLPYFDVNTFSFNAPLLPIGFFNQTIGPHQFAGANTMHLTTPPHRQDPPPCNHPIQPATTLKPPDVDLANKLESSPQDSPSPPGHPPTHCPDCGKEFHGEYAKSNGRRHQKYSCIASIKTQCEICGKEYARPDGLRAHMKKHHPEAGASQ